MLGRMSYRNYGDDTTHDTETYTLITKIINTMQQVNYHGAKAPRVSGSFIKVVFI